ncbi:MAG: MFS transporter, partial [Candidatus Binatia bacterium]
GYPVPRNVWLAPIIYSIGFFSLSLEPIFGLLIPLWALKLGSSPLLVGIIVGGSALLPAIFSIPMGGLADRVEAKTILVFASTGTALCIVLYPLTSVWSLLALHMIVGVLSSLVWIGAQAYVAKFGSDRQRARLMGNFSSATTLGTFCGPLVVGYLLDGWGFTITFFAAGLWVLMVGLMALLLPEAGARKAPDWSELRPSLQDFKQAASLLAIPAVLLVMMATLLRLSTYAIRGSYYPVYLNGIGFSAFSIGVLNSSASLAGVFSPLGVAQLSRRIHPPRLLVCGLGLAIVPLMFTPAFTDFGALLILSVVSGTGIGITLPLLLSILANATGPELRGLTAGLRTAANRLSFTVVPILLGAITDRLGLATGFYVVGLLLMLGVGALLLYVQFRYLRMRYSARPRRS